MEGNCFYEFKRKQRENSFYLVIFSFFFNLLMLVLPLFSLQVFDRVLASRSSETLILLVGIAVFFLLFQSIFDFLRNRLLQRSAALFEVICIPKALELLLCSNQSKGQGYRTRCNELFEAKSCVGSHYHFVKYDLPWSFFFVLVIFLLNPILGWYAVCSILYITIFSYAHYLVVKGKEATFRKTAIESQSFYQKVQSIAVSVKQVLFEGALISKWSKLSWRNVEAEDAFLHRSGLIVALFKFSRQVLQVGVLGIGAWLVITEQTNLGVMIATSMLFSRLIAPFELFSSVWPKWIKQRSAFVSVSNILSSHSQVVKHPITFDKVELSFDKVTLRREVGKTILQNLQFTLKPGQCLAIIGQRGSGKSSVLESIVNPSLIASGRVRINGINNHEISRVDLMTAVGYVAQESKFFDDSIINNITGFNVTEENLLRAESLFKELGINDVICNLPDGYHTCFVNGDIPLSSGEKRYLSIARALFYKPKLLLLDEPESCIECSKESYLLNIIARCKNDGVSIISVSNRYSVLSSMDWVISLEEGKINAAGSSSMMLSKVSSLKGTL